MDGAQREGEGVKEEEKEREGRKEVRGGRRDYSTIRKSG